VLGDNVTLKSGVYLWNGITLGNNVFVGPSAVFTNDHSPRSNRQIESIPTFVDDFASIGASAVIKAGIRIGKYAMIGMGAVVTKDVPDYAMVYGNPARVMGYVDEEGEKLKKMGDGNWVSKDGNIYFETENGLKKS
jgi:acetyltransferase-like isoleucine patch superfamily enzyme